MTLGAALKVLLVDDEPLARLRMRSLLEACIDPRAVVEAEASSSSQAQHWLREHGCDLILLDVQMPGPDGLQLAEALRQQEAQGLKPPAVVFVSAHAEHALRAFDLEAMDYLTKPVRRERLQAALQRVAQRLDERAAAQARQGQPSGQGGAHELDDSAFINVSDRGRLLRVPLSEVLYFKAELKYLTLRTATQSLVMDGSLSDLEPRLGDRFLRVHRNALVAKAAVRELERHAPSPGAEDEATTAAIAGDAGEGWAVRIAGVNVWLAVSRRQIAAVREALAAQGN
ncbi:LytR/AlgR family response regulator transcription factor [Paucibacter sp. Y2R2-4]|uniref:LytR/AlgR family response regulator transcription factor n=1 Tax=Paucibacter sp. Y2R2-4 TaxID=2893553 RepID=UPI0021E49307|nr:LytTR family DNA-binding domain-containing protein [Paucibacter sp. Y2R2-4]MCV2351954.1 LytTR family DNA-binding domain-containing protein [Paucibacter sp. Y2R2-4]